jgi:hypothetical protein
MFISTPIAGPSVGAVALPDGLRERADPGESRPIDIAGLGGGQHTFWSLESVPPSLHTEAEHSNCCQYPVQRREKPTEPAY